MSRYKSMSFKEFAAWCNQRAADGHWGLFTAMHCCGICSEIYKLWFWKRNKYWHEKYEQHVLDTFVNPTQELIDQYEAQWNQAKEEKEEQDEQA